MDLHVHVNASVSIQFNLRAMCRIKGGKILDKLHVYAIFSFFFIAYIIY